MQVLEKGEYVGNIQTRFNERGVIASVSSYNGNRFNDSWHYHVNAHISFVLKGGRSEKKKDRYECLPGKAIFYRAGEPHQIINMHNSTHINLEMDDSFFKQYDMDEQVLGGIIPQTPDAQFLMLKIYKELLAADQFTSTSIHMLLLDFLHRSENWRDTASVPPWLKDVHTLLHDRWDEKISLADLSNAVDIHPVTISHYFPKYFSCTLGAYMRKLKVEKAMNLLNAPDASLSAIAYECGFFDQSHFIRIFKEFTGFLPAQYQKL
jgi:AraC family transcriptional regulator